jgi:hypothetical protein
MKTAAELRAKARRYRELARTATDKRLENALMSLADEYDALAKKLERDGDDG